MIDAPVTRVALADRPGLGRDALATLVSGTPGVALVATLSDTREIEPAVRATHPDVVVVDDRLLRDAHWSTGGLGARVIVVGVDDDPAYVDRARRLGAEAWIAKERADALLPLRLTAPAELTPRCP